MTRRSARDTSVLHGLDGQRALQRGMAMVERAVGSTLGPGGRRVVVERIGQRERAPELIADAGILARRITGVTDPFVNIGLMLNRHVAWKVHRTAGDGSGTAAVICATTHRELLRQAAAGVDPLELRRGVARAIDAIRGAIELNASPIHDAEVGPFISSTGCDEELTQVVVDALGVLGTDAVIVVRDSVRERPALEIIEGAMWESTAPLRDYASLLARPRVLEHPSVVIWDGDLDDPGGLVHVLRLVRERGARGCLFVARTFSSAVVAVVEANDRSEFPIAAVAAPFQGANQDAALHDLAAIAAGQVLSLARGDVLGHVRFGDIGHVRRATVGRTSFNVLSTDLDRSAVVSRVESVRHQLDESDDEDAQVNLLARLGRLTGGMGLVSVGGHNEAERSLGVRAARQGVTALRAAQRHGVVPGGGAAYLAAARELEAEPEIAHDPGARAVLRALRAPSWWIARNAGLDADASVRRGIEGAPVHGIDVLTGQLVGLRQAGVIDAADTVIEAMTVGASTAALAMTCDVILAHPNLPLDTADFAP